MLPFETLVIVDKSLPSPVYLQIANSITKHIRDGIIRPGTLLPGTRELAKILNIHRKTAIAAYNELTAQGWIDNEERKRHVVVQNLPELKLRRWDEQIQAYTNQSIMPVPFLEVRPLENIEVQESMSSFNLIIDDGHPDTRLAPMELLHREYKSLINRQYAINPVPHTTTSGSIKLRETLVNYLSQTRGLQATVANILITHGSQMSIYIAASLLVKPGDCVIVGEPGYFMANLVFEQLQAKIIRVPVDENGLDLEAVSGICRKHNVSMLYLIPHHHHPTTVTLSPERRMRLLELAEVYNFAIIEDDYDYDFHYSSSPYLPLASGNHHNRVIYIGSFSKCLSVSLRIGFMVASADFIRQAAHMRKLIDLKGDHIMENALAILIENGDIGRHIKKVNKIYAERRNHLCKLFDVHLKDIVKYKKPTGGMAVWTAFDKRYPLAAISLLAAKSGLFMNSGKLFDTEKNEYNALRFGYASMNFSELSSAVTIIEQCAKMIKP